MNFFAKAAILETIGQPLVVRDISIPALQFGQILVRVLFSGVCRSQVMEVLGGRGPDSWLPHLLGHEGSGIVVGIGEGVSKVAVGDEVILGWVKSSGIDAPGAKYSCDGRLINSGPVTTFSNYTIVSENRVVKKPSNLPFDVAVLYGCALPTGAGMVLNELKPSPEKTVAILGLGGIGISALLMLKALGIKTIFAIDISNKKLDLATRLGADYSFSSLDQNLAKKISSLTNGGVDYCIESAGLVATIEMGFSLVRKNGGQLLFASHPSHGSKINLDPYDLICGKRIAGSWGGASQPDIDIPKIFNLFQKSSSINIGALLTKRYKLFQINEALEDLLRGDVFRPIIEMSDH